MKKIGFLGCGKIGQKMLEHIRKNCLADVIFILDPYFKGKTDILVVEQWEDSLCSQADLVIECATADVLKQTAEKILQVSDLLSFSVTAFSDAEFQKKIALLREKTGKRIYFPHGAILGLDGIFDGRDIITEVSITTTKNPKSLGRDDDKYTVLYEGPTRKACELYPRNVNVHAEIALAGIGFDRTVSKIISDPSVHTNTHIIKVKGEGIDFEIKVSSFSTGGVTGVYTPLSACGSLDRLLGRDRKVEFV